jgi:hypothetical protein
MGRILERINNLSSKLTLQSFPLAAIICPSHSFVCGNVVRSQQSYYTQYQHTPRRRRKRGIYYEKKIFTYCSFLKVAATIVQGC